MKSKLRLNAKSLSIGDSTRLSQIQCYVQVEFTFRLILQFLYPFQVVHPKLA